uniref:Uncharacterized protein n=1 Tax=Rhizophora mucronata TaxID=61149 RepID=A0A2P2P3N6_RHIMU
MTVDGKYTTSFAYHETLEPWLVSESKDIWRPQANISCNWWPTYFRRFRACSWLSSA